MGPAWSGFVAILLLAHPAAAAIHFENFSSTPELSFVGDAGISGKALRLTPAKGDRSGAVWLREKQPVGSGFETTFQFQLTKNGGLGHGADGFAFVLQNAGPDAMGGRGSAGGFAVSDSSYHHDHPGIPWSFAVFFDTFRNGDEGDPSNNYVAFCTHGRPADMRWPAPRVAFTPKLRVRLKDGSVHTARILFQPPVLSVFLDNAPRPVLESDVDLSIVVDRQGEAWVGFTASTGGGYENHDILSWTFGRPEVTSNMSVVSSQISFAMTGCLPDRNLCTPQRTLVDQTATGYHVLLPANREWGASVPSPSGRLEVANAHGIVCWDVKERGSDGCSGPSGTGATGGPGLLDPQSPPGSLVVERHGGRTWFSINGRRGAFLTNEGFFEFDVELKPNQPVEANSYR